MQGIDETWISNTNDGVMVFGPARVCFRADNMQGEDDGLPFHPTCFELFKRISMDRLGRVDIDGLWSYWREVSPTST